jgi:ATP-dependent Clp protease protease subunit
MKKKAMKGHDYELVGLGPDLLEHRILYVQDFDEYTERDIVTDLLSLEAEDPRSDIVMYISSYGGYVDSFLAIHDVIKSMRCDVATIGVGKAMSCGQMLLISGTQGKRFMMPNARVLVHESSSWTTGQLSDMEVELEELKRMEELCNELTLKYTNLKKRQLTNMLKKETYITAQEALDYGFVDEILTSHKQLYEIVKIRTNK